MIKIMFVLCLGLPNIGFAARPPGCVARLASGFRSLAVKVRDPEVHEFERMAHDTEKLNYALKQLGRHTLLTKNLARTRSLSREDVARLRSHVRLVEYYNGFVHHAFLRSLTAPGSKPLVDFEPIALEPDDESYVRNTLARAAEALELTYGRGLKR